MDAKRIRVRGDENAPTSLPANKVVHQRNKSTSALNATALGARNGARRAFGDLSNVKASGDDSTVGAKPVPQASEPKPVLSQPAQRPSSMSGLKGLLSNVTSKPENPAGKVQPVARGTGTRRSNMVFRDHLQPVVEREASSTDFVHRGAGSVENQNEEEIVGKKESSIVADVNKVIDRQVADLIEGPSSRPTIVDSNNTLSDTDEIGEHPHSRAVDSIASEREEYSDDDEVDEHGGLVSPTRLDNTTGGMTVHVFPEDNLAIKRELLRAQRLVEIHRTEEDIEEDNYDTSLVAEYGDDIFAYLRRQEIRMLPVQDYMAIQVEIQWSMRGVLMDWLVQVHHRFALLPETLFLCVNYIDRFLSYKIVSLGKLQLVGATALLIAAKYEEITSPSIEEIIYMVDGGYTTDEVLKAERFMLMMLGYELGWPGPMSFLRRISKADDYQLETRTLAKYFLEVMIMDECFVATPPSFAAAGAHCLAIMMLHNGIWTADHAYYSGYVYKQLVPIMNTIKQCCENPSSHQAIFEKYSDKRFQYCAIYAYEEIKSGFFVPGAVPFTHYQRRSGETNF